MFIISRTWQFSNFYAVKQFQCQPDKMVKLSQRIRRLLPTNYLSVFDHFVGLALKRLKKTPYNCIMNNIQVGHFFRQRGINFRI